MAQIVHGPAIFDDEERYPFGTVLCKEYPYPENQGEGFYEPKDPVKDLFVAGLGFVVGDVSKKLPHGLIFPRNGKSMDCRPPVYAVSFSSATWSDVAGRFEHICERCAHLAAG
jgi:hypothetical protein